MFQPTQFCFISQFCFTVFELWKWNKNEWGQYIQERGIFYAAYTPLYNIESIILVFKSGIHKPKSLFCNFRNQKSYAIRAYIQNKSISTVLTNGQENSGWTFRCCWEAGWGEFNGNWTLFEWLFELVRWVVLAGVIARKYHFYVRRAKTQRKRAKTDTLRDYQQRNLPVHEEKISLYSNSFVSFKVLQCT